MNKSVKAAFKVPVYFISFVLLISIAGCSSAKKISVMPTMQNDIEFKPTEYKVVVTEPKTKDKFLSVNSLVTYDDINDLSFKIDNCNLKAVYVKKNDQVEEGQLLAELDSADLEFQISAKQIDLERLQLKYDQIQSNPGMEPADKDIELECIKLDMESVNLDISYIEELISRTKLTAPYAGEILDIKAIQPGTPVMAYDKVMTICKPDNIIVRSDILNPYNSSGNNDISGVVTGMKVTLISGSMDKLTEIPATITKIINVDPGVQPNTSRVLSAPPPFWVYVKPDGDYADKLSADRSVTLKINTGKLENVIVLPVSAVTTVGSDQIVKIKKGEKAIARRVTTGYVDTEERSIVVTSGLRPGESVILD